MSEKGSTRYSQETEREEGRKRTERFQKDKKLSKLTEAAIEEEIRL